LQAESASSKHQRQQITKPGIDDDSPLISIFSHLLQQHNRPKKIHFIYGTKASGSSLDGDKILFLTRIRELIRSTGDPNVQLELFLTGVSQDEISRGKSLPPGATAGRITGSSLESALGEEGKRQGTLCYVCGPPRMTDSFVDFLRSRKGMDETRVLCEKWW